jgi:hypothetical protein
MKVVRGPESDKRLPCMVHGPESDKRLPCMVHGPESDKRLPCMVHGPESDKQIFFLDLLYLYTHLTAGSNTMLPKPYWEFE